MITIVGVGGYGMKMLDYLIDNNLKGVKFLAVNTDREALNKCKASEKLLIGESLTGGLGAHGDPDIAEKAAIEDKDIIANALKNTHMAIIAAGMGGGTGTGAAPVIAQITNQCNAFTVGLVTMPFPFEGSLKNNQTEKWIARLRESTDIFNIVKNQMIFGKVDKKASIRASFDFIHNIQSQIIMGILRGLA